MKKITFSQKAMRLLFSSILIISLFSQGLAAYAGTEIPPELTAMKEDLLKKLPDTTLALCKDGLVPVYDVEIITFMKWIEGHFQNKSSTSSLVNTAIVRYSEFKKSLKSIFAEVSPQYSADQGVQVFDKQFEGYALCAAITESYLELAKEHLKQHIRDNVAKKKTMMFLEKYQKINEKLRDLNIKVAEMYSLFVTFTNKLPFFVKNCQ